MAREVPVDVAILDQFSVYEPDGYTKHSGLTQAGGDFPLTLYFNGTINATQTVVIQEIGTTGEYLATFTPNQVGYWELEVQIPYNKDIWHGRYDVVTPDGAALPGQKYREQVNDNFGNAMPYVTVNIYEAGTANLLSSKQTDYNGYVEFDLTGPLYNPGLVDIEFIGGGIEAFKKEGVKITG